MKNFIGFNLVLPGAFFVFALCFMPIDQVFQFDPNDEGIELIKASLHLDGFAMYTQMWNDQPPLSTVILSFWFRLFGQSILAARLLTLTLSTALVWAFCQTLRLTLGNIAAIIGTCFLVISCNFLRLSVSVMFGLPAVALAMLSIYAITLYKQKRSFFLVILSGVLFGLSLQMKLFTAFIAPLIIVDLIQTNFTQLHRKRGRQTLLLDILLWLFACFLTFIFIGVLCHSLTYQQLLETHFDSSVKDAFKLSSSLKLTLTFLLQDFDYLLLALLAAIALFKNRQWEHSFPLIWLITAFILLLTHRPVWYHHYLLVSLPLTWLATYGVTLIVKKMQTKTQWLVFKRQRIPPRLLSRLLSILATGCLIFSILLIPVKLGVTQYENQRLLLQSQGKNHVVDVMRSYKASTHWVFTDCPIYPFYAGLKVPPEIAVLSFIRIESNMITQDQLLAVLEKYQPEQTLLCKSATLQSGLEPYIQQHYIKIHEYEIGTHYLSKDLWRSSLS